MPTKDSDINITANLQRTAQVIADTYATFAIPLKFKQAAQGAVFTRYEFEILSPKIRMNNIAMFTDDLRVATATDGDIVIDSSLDEPRVFGVEIPNVERDVVELDELLKSPEFANAKGELVFAVGSDVYGKTAVADLSRLPHLLVGGTTGSGKTTFLQSMIVSLSFKYGPEHVRFLLCDLKGFDLSVFKELPHALVPRIIDSVESALSCLDYLTNEMERRYELFRKYNVVNIRDYNNLVPTNSQQELPYLVFVVDELADIMAASKQNFEYKFLPLSQKCRSAGIHLVLSTQRPDTVTLSGTIKANVPARIAFKVCSAHDSATILNCGKAQKLSGQGDMYFTDDCSKNPKRLQGGYISYNDLRYFVDFLKQTDSADFDNEAVRAIFIPRDTVSERGFDNALLKCALRILLERYRGEASISALQRSMQIGFNKAGRLLEELQNRGYVEAFPTDENFLSKPRVLVSLEDLDDLFPDDDD